MRKVILLLGLGIIMLFHLQAQQVSKRRIQPSDIYRLHAVSEPQVSPDGHWVAYTVTTIDSLKDKRNSDVWMVSWDGSQDIQLTNSPDGESMPKWSPDGKFISFLSSRQDSHGSQVWLLDRRGGEGRRLTDIKGGINTYQWSPDGTHLLLTITDQEPEDSSKIKTTKPYVINRYRFKADVEGYLHKKLFTHLYLFDLSTKKLDTLTRGDYDEQEAVWSPTGTEIAFVSNRTQDPDKNENSDIFVIAAKPGALPRQLTSWKGSDNSPQWSPDGKWIAYTRTTSEADYIMYDEHMLALISREGGNPKILSASLDRPVSSPRWTKDGLSVMALVTDDRRRYVAEFPVAGNSIRKIAGGDKSYSSLEAAPGGQWILTCTDPQTPLEVYALEGGKPRKLTSQTEAFLAPLQLAKVEGFTSTSADGTLVSGILYRPSDTPAKWPTILFIHGGPVGQDEFDFDMTRQILAGGGFAVVAVNYRGSNGRGLDYCKVISGDWGNKEVLDLHGAMDYLVQKGIADSSRLGVGGWSYGGILTDYLIASDNRFKAACSGAGTGFTLSLYGVDQYINQYNNEIGAPWKNIEGYLKISYPLLKADRIKTPTLFMSGDKDFNVPTAGSEQMYQALRTLGIPAELVIYPGQFHGISTPSYIRDRLDRYLAWYRNYLK